MENTLVFLLVLFYSRVFSQSDSLFLLGRWACGFSNCVVVENNIAIDVIVKDSFAFITDLINGLNILDFGKQSKYYAYCRVEAGRAGALLQAKGR